MGKRTAMHDTPRGVLLLAYGTPGTLSDVADYYTNVRHGRRPSPEQIAELTERYRTVGGHTPLLEITRMAASRLQERLNAENHGRYRVYIGMKYWHPFIADTLSQMQADGVQEAIGLALAPHY